jgi:hypothetical protein
VDAKPADEELLESYHPGDLAAVEFYRGASGPAEFGINTCGLVLVWTKFYLH